VKKILIYNSGGGLGDSIQIIPLILSLKNHYRRSTIFYLGAHPNHFEGKLKEYNINIEIYDPLIDKKEVQKIYGINAIQSPKVNYYDAIILAVAHSEFLNLGYEAIRNFGKDSNILYDLKYLFDKSKSDLRL